MKLKNRKLTIFLASTAALGALAVSPFLETQVKADINAQLQSIAKTGTTATKAATIAEGTSPVRQAIIDQLATKGINYQTMTTKQQQNAYVDVIVQLTAKPAAENGSVTANYSSTAEIQAASKAVIAAQAGVKAAVKTV
ncbi:hypothetical protein, partial [Lacticaseibacillus suihuaensis]